MIQALKIVFSHHGIPDSLVSDNGPANASEKVWEFASKWEFKHITTSPHYQQANGKAESTVKMCNEDIQNSLKEVTVSKIGGGAHRLYCQSQPKF